MQRASEKAHALPRSDREDAKEQIARIRKALKALPGGKTLSVRNSTGTAWGWVAIWGSAEKLGGTFTDAESALLRRIGLHPGSNFANIEPDSRRYWVNYLEELVIDQEIIADLASIEQEIADGNLRRCRECGWVTEWYTDFDAQGGHDHCAQCGETL